MAEDMRITAGLDVLLNPKSLDKIQQQLDRQALKLRPAIEQHPGLKSTRLSVASLATQHRNVAGITPTQAVERVLGNIPRTPSIRKLRNQARDLVRGEETAQKLKIQQEKDESRLQRRLGQMTNNVSPLERIQQRIQSNQVAQDQLEQEKQDSQQKATELLTAEIKKGINIIKKSRGVPGGISSWDKRNLSALHNRILSNTALGESPSADAQEFMKAFEDLSSSSAKLNKTISKLGTVVGATVKAATMIWSEMTREANIDVRQARISGYRYADAYALERMGVNNPDQIISDAGMYRTQVLMGERDLGTDYLFGRNITQARMRGTTSMRELVAAFARDVALAESGRVLRGQFVSRQFVAKKLGMESLFPVLAMSPEEQEMYFRESEAQDAVQAQAHRARMLRDVPERWRGLARAYRSRYKAGALATDVAEGALFAAAGGVIGAGIGALLTGGAAAAPGYLAGGAVGLQVYDWMKEKGWVGNAGSYAQDFLQDGELNDSPEEISQGVQLASTTNIILTPEAARELKDNGQYTWYRTDTLSSVA